MSEGVLPPPPEPPKEPPSLIRVIGHVALAVLWIDFLRDPAKTHGAVTIALTMHYAADYWFKPKGVELVIARGAMAVIALWGTARGEGWFATLVAVLSMVGVVISMSESDS